MLASLFVVVLNKTYVKWWVLFLSHGSSELLETRLFIKKRLVFKISHWHHKTFVMYFGILQKSLKLSANMFWRHIQKLNDVSYWLPACMGIIGFWKVYLCSWMEKGCLLCNSLDQHILAICVLLCLVAESLSSTAPTVLVVLKVTCCYLN